MDTVKLNYALIAEYAGVSQDDRVTVAGILDNGFEISTKNENTLVRFFIVTSYRISEKGKYTNKAVVQTGSGDVISTFSSKLDVTEPGNFGTVAPVKLNLSSGTYSVSFKFEETLFHEINFTVKHIS